MLFIKSLIKYITLIVIVVKKKIKKNVLGISL